VGSHQRLLNRYRAYGNARYQQQQQTHLLWNRIHFRTQHRICLDWTELLQPRNCHLKLPPAADKRNQREILDSDGRPPIIEHKSGFCGML